PRVIVFYHLVLLAAGDEDPVLGKEVDAVWNGLWLVEVEPKGLQLLLFIVHAGVGGHELAPLRGHEGDVAIVELARREDVLLVSGPRIAEDFLALAIDLNDLLSNGDEGVPV